MLFRTNVCCGVIITNYMNYKLKMCACLSSVWRRTHPEVPHSKPGDTLIRKTLLPTQKNLDRKLADRRRCLIGGKGQNKNEGT